MHWVGLPRSWLWDKGLRPSSFSGKGAQETLVGKWGTGGRIANSRCNITLVTSVGFIPQGKPRRQVGPHVSERCHLRGEGAGTLIHPLPQSVVEGCFQEVLFAWHIQLVCVASRLLQRKSLRQRYASHVHRNKCWAKMGVTCSVCWRLNPGFQTSLKF